MHRQLGQWAAQRLLEGMSAEALFADLVARKLAPEIAQSVVKAATDVISESHAYLYQKPRGAQGAVIDTADRRIHVSVRLNQPTLAILDDALSPEECAALIKLAKTRLRPSLSMIKESPVQAPHYFRNSSSAVFKRNENSLIAAIEQRASTIMGLPMDHGEMFEVIHYQVGQEFKHHYDFFLSKREADAAEMARNGQRVSTLIFYLSDVDAGGETIFPKLGLSIAPKVGAAVYFEYMNQLGQLDHKTVHAGTPVLAGKKWIMTKWMRERPITSFTK